MDHIDVITDCHPKNGDVTSNGRSKGSRTRHEGLRNHSGSEIVADYPQDIFGVNQFKDPTTLPRCEHYKCRSDTCKPLNRQKSSTRSERSSTSYARRRQNEDSCTAGLRTVLHGYNVLILVLGCAALGIGIWQLVIDFGARKVTPMVDNQLYEVTTYLIIAGGGAVALLAFCGCCGTIREDKCVLSFYGTTLAIVFILFNVAIGTAIFFREEVLNEKEVQLRMRDTLMDHYGVEVRQNTQNRRITDSWDAMQRQLKCCGVVGNVSHPHAWVFYSTNTKWSGLIKDPQRKVPDSCCSAGNIRICTGQEEFDGPPRYYKPHKKSRMNTNPHLYTNGCYKYLTDHLRKSALIIAIVSGILAGFLLFGVLISFCLCARVKGIFHDYEVDL